VGIAVSLAFALWTNTSAAEEASLGAREHFARGVELMRSGEFDRAAEEFEGAYQVSPHYSVLYNLGQAYAAIGKPVEAARAFSRYLELGASAVGPARRAEVEDSIRRLNQRITRVLLNIEPRGADVFLDGRALDPTSLSAPIQLTTGTHHLQVTHTGYMPAVQPFEAPLGRTESVSVKLAPIAPVAAAVGQLSLTCAVPATSVWLDQNALPLPRSEPLLVTGGRHTVDWNREGYVAKRATVDVVPLQLTHIDCGLVPLATLSRDRATDLSVVVSEPKARIAIDGTRIPAATRIPIGPHVIEVQRQGFENWNATIVARPGQQTVNADLKPTVEHLQDEREAARSRRTWAYASGGVGAGVLGAGIVVYLLNGQSFRHWSTDRDAFNADLEAQHWSPTLAQRSNDLQSRAASIRTHDDIALGLSAVGSALITYAIVTLLDAKH